MNPIELEASLRVLLAVALADGEVASDERRLLAGVAEQLGVPLTIDPKAGDDLYAALHKITSEEGKRITFDAALALANVDGKCAPAEHEILMRIRDALAPQSTIPLEKTERQWGAKMKKARAEIDHVSDTFLDDIAAHRDSLTPLAYQKMVADLERKKSDVLRHAISDD